MQHGDQEKYKSFTAACRRASRHSKQMWTDREANEGEEQLKLGHSGNTFVNFRQMQMSGLSISSPVHDMNDNLLSDHNAIFT